MSNLGKLFCFTFKKIRIFQNKVLRITTNGRGSYVMKIYKTPPIIKIVDHLLVVNKFP